MGSENEEEHINLLNQYTENKEGNEQEKKKIRKMK